MEAFDQFCEGVLDRYLGASVTEPLQLAMLDKGVLAIDLAFESDGRVGELRDSAIVLLCQVPGLDREISDRATWEFDGVNPYLVALIAGLRRESHTFPLSVFNVENLDSRVLQSHPNLANSLDQDGLVFLDAIEADDWGFDFENSRFHYHQLLRRNFVGSMNSELVGDVIRIGRQPGNVARISYDGRRLTTKSEFTWSLEEDYWYGPPLTNDFLDDPYAIGHAVHKYPDGDARVSLGYIAVDAQWRLDHSGHKVLQMEELVSPASELICGHRVLRYLHAIRDIKENRFIHCDGAVRCYTGEQYSIRQGEDVHTAQKASKYRKIFRLDGSISSEDWSTVVVRWFRGNRLVEEYLSTLSK